MQHSQLLGDIYEEYAKGLDMVFHDFKEEAFHTGAISDGCLLVETRLQI